MRNHAAVTAYLALGSNLGDRAANIHAALHRLGQLEGTHIVRVSSLLAYPAVGGPPDSPPYLNAAAEISTTLFAHALLHGTLEIEEQMGRVRRVKWESRIIDIDLLLYADHIVSSQELVVPHPLMHERRFVLEPLAEESRPEAVHPILQMRIAALLDDLKMKEMRSAPARGTSPSG